MLALLLLSGVAAAQGLKLPVLHRDPVDAQQAALHDKLTRLAETRRSLDMPEVRPSSTPELDALTAAARKSRPVNATPGKRPGAKLAAAKTAAPPNPQVVAQDDGELSLGEVARRYRAQKRLAQSSTKQ